MRGVPGSGKSALAKVLAFDQAAICSADDFFVRADGTYKWDPVSLGAAHKACRDKLVEQMMRGISPLVVDNTNIKSTEVETYEALARGYNYEITLVKMKPPADQAELDAYVDECVSRGTHAVPRETVRRMAERLRNDE